MAKKQFGQATLKYYLALDKALATSVKKKEDDAIEGVRDADESGLHADGSGSWIRSLRSTARPFR